MTPGVTPLVIRSDPRKTLLGLLLLTSAFGFAIGSPLWALARADALGRVIGFLSSPAGLVGAIIFVASALLVLAFSLVLLRNLVRPPTLTLDAQGFRLDCVGGPVVVRWIDVEAFDVFHDVKSHQGDVKSHQRLVGWRYKSTMRPERPWFDVKPTAFLDESLGAGWRGDSDHLCVLLEEWRARHGLTPSA